METKLHYTNDTNQGAPVNLIQKGYLNIARDLSRVNSKNEEITTRDGHVFGYLCQIKMKANASTTLIFSSAPNSWKMRNSFRKFHAYRNMMFENAGVEGEEMGRYGKTIRPLLDASHRGNDFDTLVPATTKSNVTPTDPGDEVYFSGGEWLYTQLATVPLYGQGPKPGDTGETWADRFPLHICEENAFDVAPSDDASGTYDSVGMIHSYNLDRMEVVTPSSLDEVLSSPSNPLAALRASGNQAAGEILDLAIDQELEKPPYDIDDDGPSIMKVIENIQAVPTTGGTVSFTAFLPAGLGAFYLSQASSTTTFEVTVLDKILCKDMA